MSSRRRPRSKRAVPGPTRREPWIQLDARPGDDPPWVAVAGWIAIALATALLAWLAFGLHVVGDYFTESDFYGGYAEGARLLRHGSIDPGRYGSHGPVYEIALALGGTFLDLFTAAKVISVAGSVAMMICTFVLVARRARVAAALWTVLFLAANAVFLRYGFSATNDALAAALQIGCVFAVVAARDRRAPLLAGVLAALAALTRYSAVALVPATLVVYALLERPAGVSRWRAIGLFLGGFAILALPWIAFSLSQGHVPAGDLTGRRFAEFYANPDPSRNVQDLTAAARDSMAAAARGGTQAGGGRLLANLVEHLRRDLLELLGWPVALACGLGLAIALRDRLGRSLAPYWVCGAFLFAALVPVFYSDRYTLPYLPVWLSFAGIAVGSPLLALLVRGLPVPFKWLLALWPLALVARATERELRDVLSQMPVEVVETGRVLREVAAPGSRLMSRKAHVGYYADLTTVPFPRIGSVAELGAYAHAQRVDYLYFSWYEAELRPEFWALLDTAQVLPGLSVVHATEVHPSVLYRIGSSFGATPSWFANDTLRAVPAARAQVRVLPEALAWGAHFVLGRNAAREGRFDDARRHFEAAVRGKPDLTDAWIGLGEAAGRLARADIAEQAFTRALELEPNGDRALIGLGLVHLQSGRSRQAADTWRPLVGRVHDRSLLQVMLRLYEQVGDVATANAVRAELADRSPHD